jgi:hypothetical protein
VNISLEEIFGIKPKMSGVGHVTQAYEKEAQQEPPEHAGREEVAPSPSLPTEPPRSLQEE